MKEVELKKLETENGIHKITGVWDGQERYCTAKKIIAHPNYMKILGLENRLKKTSITRRSICITDHSISQVGDSNTVQVILP